MKSKLTSSLAFIGTGNMAEAIISGLVRNKVISPSKIIGFDVDRKKLASLSKSYGIRSATNLNNAANADIVILSVKPQQFADLLPQLQLAPHQLVVSIAAGIDTQSITRALGKSIKIARVMPNTPLLVGCGASVYFATKKCSALDKKNVETLFGASGLVMETKKEDELDAVTGLSGSGPAYVYQFIQGLIDGGVAVGIKPDIARKLAIATVTGAAHLLEISSENPDELTKKVASKGGTTEAALKVLAQKKFKSILVACVKEATRKATNLRKLS